MPARNRRGFTLPELLVAIVIFAIVSTAIYGLLVRTQRLSRTQAERSIMQANIRTGIALVTSELRELNVDTTNSVADIYSMSATAIEYRGMRGLGFICQVGDNYLVVPRGAWNGYRDPQASRDLIMIFVDNDVKLDTDDGWIERTVTGTAPTTCPSGGAAIQLDFSGTLPSETLAMITVGSPVRTFERMQIGQMIADGEFWLGARSVSAGEGSLQPVLGPLSPTNPVTFTYYSGVAPGATTSTPSQVRTIRLDLRGVTENIVAAGAGTVAWERASDLLRTDIRLRNAP